MYDYSTLVNRSDKGSAKWNLLLKDQGTSYSNIPPLSTADCDMVYPKELTEGLKEFMDEMIFGYTDPTKAYFESLYHWFKKKHNVEFFEDEIVLSPGVVNALFNLVKTFSAPNDGVIIFSPVYYPFSNSIAKTGRRVVECRLVRNKENSYEIDFNAFKELAQDKNNKLLIFCSPHNPIGRVWRKDELEQVSKICEENNVFIISDEIHCDITLFNHSHTCFSTINPNAVICTAPSKTFNLAGLQTSNIIFKNKKHKKDFENLLDTQGSFRLNSVGLKACEIAYSKCEKWLDGFLKLIETNHLLFKNFAEKNFNHLKVSPMEGTYLQWLNCQALNKDDKILDEFFRKKAILYLDPGFIFGKGGEGFMRFNIACPTAVLEDALNRLKKAISEDK